MEPMGKVLQINLEKCTGCRLCELVCSVFHDGASNAARSRIKVVKWEQEGLYIPMSCQQCQDAPCMIVCREGHYPGRDTQPGDGESRYMHWLPVLRDGLPFWRDEF